MRRMHRVGEQHRFIGVQMVQQVLIRVDESVLLLRIELTRHRFRLAVLHAQPVQQSDQARLALVIDAALLLDQGADIARCSRQSLGDPGCQLALLRFAQATGAAFVAEACQALDLVFLIQLILGADRIVVQQQDFRDGFAAHAVVEQHQRVRPPLVLTLQKNRIDLHEVHEKLKDLHPDTEVTINLTG